MLELAILFQPGPMNMFQPQAMNIINLLTWKVLQIIQRDSLEKLFNTVQSVVPLPVPQDMNYIPDQDLNGWAGWPIGNMAPGNPPLIDKNFPARKTSIFVGDFPGSHVWLPKDNIAGSDLIITSGDNYGAKCFAKSNEFWTNFFCYPLATGFTIRFS